MSVNFLASENWCGQVHFEGHLPERRVLSKFRGSQWGSGFYGSRLIFWLFLRLTVNFFPVRLTGVVKN